MKWIWCGLSMACLLIAAAEAADDWAQKFPATAPSARAYAGMAYIGDDHVLLFGGYDTANDDETWVYDISESTWTQKFPVSHPTARREHGTAYIGDDKVLLFGGDLEGPLDNTTWVYDLSDNTWTNKAPATSPSARAAHGMAYIGSDKVLLFGGWVPNVIGETWVYDLSANTWTRMYPATEPSARRAHAMAYLGSDNVLLFGGDKQPYVFSDETWVYDLSQNAWTLKDPDIRPSARWGHDMVYLGADQCMLFGGDAAKTFQNDTWIYDLSNDRWTQDDNSVQPSARKEIGLAESCMDGSSNVVLFGGTTGAVNGETWTFGGGDHLIGRPSVTLISPNGGEALVDSTSITWTALDPNGGETNLLLVDLDYSANAGSTWSVIDSNEANDSEYSWDFSGLFSGTNYLVRIMVTDTTGLADFDTSDAIFSVDGYDPPQVTLTHPNGGEILVDSITITWAATDPDPEETPFLSINLDYSDNNGASWSAVDSNQANDGAYYWDLSGLPDDADYLIRIMVTDTVGLFDSDTSDAVFEINDPPPHIASVQDVPEDQGRQVSVLWDRSGLDQPAYHAITHYSIWRKTPIGSKIVIIGDEWDNNLPKNLSGTIYRVISFIDAKGDIQKGYWELVGTQEAHYFEGYSYTAPTQYDSSAGHAAYFSFIVSAHTEDPYIFYDSAPDSGYSVDDIDPAKTQVGILASGGAKGSVNTVWLSWTRVTTGEDGSPEQGPIDYRIYCDENSDFVAGPGNLVATTPDLSYSHTDPRIGDPAANLFYLVIAADGSGNESAVSNMVGEFDRSLRNVK